MMTIANPIYDSMFKFLMVDERVARTILSALLKKNIYMEDDMTADEIAGLLS